MSHKKKDPAPDLKNEIDILMTQAGKADMNLTPGDQQFLIRYLDLRDNVIFVKLAEILSPMFEKLESISNDIGHIKCQISELEYTVKNIKTEVEDIRDIRLKNLEDEFHKHRRKTWINVAIGITIGLLFATIIALLIHYNLPIKNVKLVSLSELFKICLYSR